MTAETSTGQEFVISRIFEAPRERVWRAFTDPSQIVDGSCEPLAVGLITHDRSGDHDFHARGPDLIGCSPILSVDDQDVHQARKSILIVLGDTQCGRLTAECLEQPVRGATQGSTSHDGAHRDDGHGRAPERIGDARHREDRADAQERVGRRQE